MSTPISQSGTLSAALRNPEPFLSVRLGATEASIVGQYLSNSPKYSSRLRQSAWNNAGIFPPLRSTLEFFSNEYLNAVKSADILAAWPENTLPHQDVVLDLNPNASRIDASSLDAVQMASVLPPDAVWTQALEGQKVLVVHSMADTISSQAKHLEVMHKRKILPHFDVFTFKPPQTQGFSLTSGAFPSNLALASSNLEQIISDNKIDVVLLAAGAYGLPLALSSFKAGAKSIYIGGSLQLLFGINGRRWQANPAVDSMKTAFWLERSLEGRPSGSGLVEGSTYW
jgi:hypothetical protein